MSTPQSDAHAGMAWWNSLDEYQRAEWMDRAGNTGVAADAWEAYKNYEPPEPDGECYRGGEAAAYEAEQMDRIQRELK